MKSPTPAKWHRLDAGELRIVRAKRSDGAADTAGLERELDERVYRLYGLTVEEIKNVEEAGK